MPPRRLRSTNTGRLSESVPARTRHAWVRTACDVTPPSTPPACQPAVMPAVIRASRIASSSAITAARGMATTVDCPPPAETTHDIGSSRKRPVHLCSTWSRYPHAARHPVRGRSPRRAPLPCATTPVVPCWPRRTAGAAGSRPPGCGSACISRPATRSHPPGPHPAAAGHGSSAGRQPGPPRAGGPCSTVRSRRDLPGQDVRRPGSTRPSLGDQRLPRTTQESPEARAAPKGPREEG
jgi:hypothetical protein